MEDWEAKTVTTTTSVWDDKLRLEEQFVSFLLAALVSLEFSVGRMINRASTFGGKEGRTGEPMSTC
jgi:hypothetical protein